jgi:hypothetical protein
MQKAGYVKTGLQMMPHTGEDLQFWEVGEGVLIIRYSKASLKIVGMTFSLADARPKALRKEFYFDVASFDTTTGTMTIHTKKGEPDGAANGSQPVHSETNSTSAAAGSGR